jgi:uncharacterized protein
MMQSGTGNRTSMAIEQSAAGQSPGPVSPWNRIDGIDALRGIALLGVLAINLVTEFRVSIFQQFLSVGHPTSSLDRAVEAFLTIAVDMKAFALFSLLFGVGLAIQFERLATHAHRTTLLLRRLIVLLIIGLLHLFLIWNGDILVEYALAGFIVLPFLFGRAGCWRRDRCCSWRCIWRCRNGCRTGYSPARR